MAVISIELLSKIERPVVKYNKNPYAWKGQIILTGLTERDRLKLNLPVSGGANDIIPMSGTVEPNPDIREIRRSIIDILQAKAKEIEESIRIPRVEYLSLPLNEKCKDTLTSLDNLNSL